MKKILIILSVLCFSSKVLLSQKNKLEAEVLKVMKNASQYLVDSVSENGGYLWHYTKDLSRRWGEMEAYKTMIWVQRPGTVSVGHVFLSAYEATGDEYYYEAAEKVADALIWGQSNEGGWHYIIDFAGDRSLKEWYNTIGKNAWRLEEFQHYYGNSTYDDDVTSDAARFILRMYLEKLDPKYKVSLDKAINFILVSQFDNGAWPQRYPLMFNFAKDGHPDYTSFYTFNDDVIGENVEFLIQCYETLGEERFLEPIRKGMNFYLMSQHHSGGWGQQYDWNMRVAGARTYEPAALLPSTTEGNAFLCLKFYEYTGDKAFLQAANRAIQWLEATILPEAQWDDRGRNHPTFIESETNRPMYVHRIGSNVVNGRYYWDYEDRDLLIHYGGKRKTDLGRLKSEFVRVSLMSVAKATENSPILPGTYKGEKTPQGGIDLNRFDLPVVNDERVVKRILGDIDLNRRWLSKHAQTSNPYIGDPTPQEGDSQTNKYASTNVGDKYDTSPYTDNSEQEYISIRTFEKNMRTLIGYINYLKK